MAPIAVASVFTIFGLLAGVMAGALPSLRDRLGTDAQGISTLLFIGAASAIVGIQVSGRLADRYGSRRMTVAFMTPLILGVVLLALVHSLPAAMGCLVLTGLGKGGTDTAMNALGVQVERARERPVMSRLHAMYSVGVLGGSGLAALIPAITGRSGEDAMPIVLISAGVITVLAWLPLLAVLPDPPPRIGRVPRSQTARIPFDAIWKLAALNVAMQVMANTAFDWASVHVTDVAEVDSGRGALGLVAVSSAMTTIRFGGDRIVSWLGRQRAVQAGAAVAMFGYFVVVVFDALPLLLCGWGIVGAGIAVMAPQIYAAAGYLGGGRALAIVLAIGSATALVWPPTMGALYRSQGPQVAMIVPLVLCLAGILLASALRSADVSKR